MSPRAILSHGSNRCRRTDNRIRKPVYRRSARLKCLRSGRSSAVSLDTYMARSSDRPSLIGRIFSTLSVERRELPSVVVSFFLFFCVLGGYFAVRPVRETVGTILGRDRVANLYVATWIASLAIVPIYGAIVAKVRRSVFLPLIYGFVAVALTIVGGVLQNQPKSVAFGQFFYVFISVLSLFLVSVVWSFLVELFDSAQAKRLFPVIAAGGSAGALVGPLFTDL